jgi:hypothetical protein
MIAAPGSFCRGSLSAFDHADGIAYHAYPRYYVTPEDGASTLDDLLGAMRSWRKPLPVWVTEFGFSTRQSDTFIVQDEGTKAAFLEAEFNLLAPRVQGPILYYKLRDWPLTSSQGLEVCQGVCPDGIGGFGLLEWRNGALIKFPAYRTFARLRGGLAAALEGAAPPAP